MLLFSALLSGVLPIPSAAIAGYRLLIRELLSESCIYRKAKAIPDLQQFDMLPEWLATRSAKMANHQVQHIILYQVPYHTRTKNLSSLPFIVCIPSRFLLTPQVSPKTSETKGRGGGSAAAGKRKAKYQVPWYVGVSSPSSPNPLRSLLITRSARRV